MFNLTSLAVFVEKPMQMLLLHVWVCSRTVFFCLHNSGPPQVNAVMWEDPRSRSDAREGFQGVKAYVELKISKHVVQVEVSVLFFYDGICDRSQSTLLNPLRTTVTRIRRKSTWNEYGIVFPVMNGLRSTVDQVE